MKKFMILFMMIIVSMGSLYTVSADTTEYFDYEVFNGKQYDFQTGLITDNELYSITSKMVMNPATTDREIDLAHDSFNHLMLFDKNNHLYGYYNTQYSTFTGGKYLGDITTLNVAIPEDVVSFAMMSYNYGVVTDDLAYTYPSIDDIAWESLTYRDIFEGTNLITDGGNLNTITSDFSGTAIGYNYTSNSLTFVWAYNDAVYLTLDVNDTYLVKITLDETSQGINNNVLIYEDGVSGSVITPSINLLSGTTTHYFLDSSQMPTFNYSRSPNGLYRFGLVEGQTGDIIINEFDIFNLTEIGFISNPTPDDFEDMRLYYERYKNVSGDTLTYSQIYGDNSRYGGSNNLIENGDFSISDVSMWADVTSGTISVVENGWFKFNSLYDYGRFQVTGLDSNHIYYETATMKTNKETYSHIGLLNYNLNSVELGSPPYGYYYADIEYALSNIITGYASMRLYAYDLNGYRDSESYVYYDNVRLYDWTSIFGLTADDIPIEDFESWYEIWEDPLQYDYTSYFTAGVMATNLISYDIRDAIVHTPNIIERKDDLFESAGIDTAPERALIGFIILIGVAIVLGLLRVQIGILIFVLYMTFILTVLLGFFETWVLIVSVIVLILLGLKKATNL